MLSWSMSNILQEVWQPLLIIGAGAVGEVYFERKDKPGVAIMVKLVALAAFLLLWLFPMFDRISWMFRGAMTLPWG
jgi:hypothetical protein